MMLLLVHAGEGLDWTGRGRAAGVSNEGVADNQLRIGYRPAYLNYCFSMIATLVRHAWGPVGAILMHGGAQKRASPATCWQISTEIPRGATCAALVDSRSTHVLHAERAGWLRDALGETGRLVW